MIQGAAMAKNRISHQRNRDRRQGWPQDRPVRVTDREIDLAATPAYRRAGTK
jgi:hypothetical protein